MRANQIQASVPAPVASLPPREPMPTVHFSMARSVHFSMAIDNGAIAVFLALILPIPPKSVMA